MLDRKETKLVGQTAHTMEIQKTKQRSSLKITFMFSLVLSLFGLMITLYALVLSLRVQSDDSKSFCNKITVQDIEFYQESENSELLWQLLDSYENLSGVAVGVSETFFFIAGWSFGYFIFLSVLLAYSYLKLKSFLKDPKESDAQENIK